MRIYLGTLLTAVAVMLGACNTAPDTSGLSGNGSTGSSTGGTTGGTTGGGGSTGGGSVETTLVALTENFHLQQFTPTAPGTPTDLGAITGLFDSTSSSDFPIARALARRPSNGKLYVLTQNNGDGLYRIYSLTGVAATLVGSGFGADDNLRGFSFDPITDQLRLLSLRAPQKNERFNPDTGAVTVDTALAYASGDANAAAAPAIQTLAYSGKTGDNVTSAIGIDTDLDNLVVLGHVNAGSTEAAAGKLYSGAHLSMSLGGFGSMPLAMTNNASPTAFIGDYNGSNGVDQSTLYQVNFSNGAVTPIGQIGSHLHVVGMVVTVTAGLTAQGSLLGLTDDLKVVQFSAGTPGTILATLTISGVFHQTVANGATPKAMALRRKNGQLFLLTFHDDNQYRLYTINISSGVATQVGSAGGNANTLARAMGIDPVADQIRVISLNPQKSSRVNPDTDALIATDAVLTYPAGDAHASATPDISSIGYTGALGATSTTVYAIDKTLHTLVTLGSAGGSPDSPNGGVLHTVHDMARAVGDATHLPFAVTVAATPAGFVVDYDAASTTSTLSRLDLTSGALTSSGAIGSHLNIVALAAVGDGGAVSSGPTGVIAGDQYCASPIGGPGTSVTSGDGPNALGAPAGIPSGCLACTITDAGNLIDNDVNNFASADLTLGLLGGSVFVAAKSPVTFPIGRIAGGTFSIPGQTPLSASLIPGLTVQTLLGNTVQDEFAGGANSLYLSLLGMGLVPGTDRFFFGGTTTKPFDTVQIIADVGLLAALPKINIYAACASTPLPGGVPAPGLPALPGGLPLP